jgi:putative transposase
MAVEAPVLGARTAMSASRHAALEQSVTFWCHAVQTRLSALLMHSNGKRVTETIRHKRESHTPPNQQAAKPGFRGWHSRGYLPHFDMPGVIQFINYRLEDAMPANLRHEWAIMLEINHELRRRTKIEEYLDRGRGCCLLRNERAAALVQANWLRFDGKRYRLLAWVVMPNHVHLLAEIWHTPQSKLIKDWKGFTARNINRVLGRSGKLWQHDYWDRYIRDEEHYRKVMYYIEWNPVRAGLVQWPEQWPFSSARFRDEYKVLRRPPKVG